MASRARRSRRLDSSVAWLIVLSVPLGLSEDHILLPGQKLGVLAKASRDVPPGEFREAGIAGVRLGLDEVGLKRQLCDERLEHLLSRDALAVGVAEPREARGLDGEARWADPWLEGHPRGRRVRDIPGAAAG